MGSERHIRMMTGVVKSDKMDKTIVVQVERRIKHRMYKKYIVRHTRFKAHDENNQCNVGDRVEIKESRPLSKDKRWSVHRVVDKAIAP